MNLLNELFRTPDPEVERAVEVMNQKMADELKLTPEQLEAKYGNFNRGDALWTELQGLSMYNGNDKDDCPCPACNARRKWVAEEATNDSLAGSPMVRMPAGDGKSVDELGIGIPGVQSMRLGDPAQLEQLLGSIFGDAPQRPKAQGMEAALIEMDRFLVDQSKPFDMSGVSINLAMAAGKALKAAEEFNSAIIALAELGKAVLKAGKSATKEQVEDLKKQLLSVEQGFADHFGI